MRNRSKIIVTVTGLVLVGAIAAMARDVWSAAPAVERVDFSATRTATTPVFDARLKPASAAHVKEFRIPMSHDTIEIAKGVRYIGWTFGHTVPGPAIRVRQGDIVRINLVNEAKMMPHSIDFHASKIPMNHAMKSVAPGDSLQFEFEATTAGVFMAHCGTAPALMHIAQGMYLPIIVDPKGGWPTSVDREFILVQSDFYPKASLADSTVMEGDWEAMQRATPTYVAFNGRAFQYQQVPLSINEGDRVRIFVVNAGPNARSDFHVVGNIFERVYPSGDPTQFLEGVQTYSVPTGGGAVFELAFKKGYSGTGTYAFVTHVFADANRGALGLIKVGDAAPMAGH
jgi:nitrite reductase (NO-forming)